MTAAKLDPTLLAAYQKTVYRVFHQPACIDLRCDEKSAAMDELLHVSGVKTAAFITAWNPLSQRLQYPENNARQQQLIADIKAAGYVCLTGEGRGLGTDWPAEESLVILGISRTSANALARTYEQNAYLFLRADHPAELVMAALNTNHRPET